MTLAAAALALALAQAGPGASWSVDEAASRVAFGIRHRLHDVDGVARELEGRAVMDAAGKVQVMVRIPVASLDTDERNRDEDLREAMEAGRHPFVVYKGVGALPVPPPRGSPVALALRGELEIHGVRRPLETKVEVTFAGDGSARAKGAFEVSLDAHGVKRPALLGMKIEDACRIAFELAMREERR